MTKVEIFMSEKYCIVSSTNARFEDWNTLDDVSYENKKQEMIETTLEAIEKLIPGVRSKIDYLEASTPRTIRRYTHHEKGSSFGTKFEGLDISMGLHKELKGLFHSGSVGIIMSGWLGAANYGVIQSYEIENYISDLEKDEIAAFNCSKTINENTYGELR